MAVGVTHVVSVSFQHVPLGEIGRCGNDLLARGWKHSRSRPWLWVAVFTKEFPEGTRREEALADVQEVMGDYWVPEEHLNQQLRIAIERIAKSEARKAEETPPPDDS